MTYEEYARIRDEKNLSDAQVAKKAGIGRSTFSDWKSGRSKPKDEKMRKIAEALDSAAREALAGLYKDGQVSLDDAVDFVEDVCLLSVCGNGMKNVPGTSGRIYTALGAYGVNIISAAQGGDELTISFVIRAADRAAAEEALAIL